MSKISKNAFTSFNGEQILESLEIELLKPDKLTIDLELEKRSANLEDNVKEIVNKVDFDKIKVINLVKDKKHVHKFDKFNKKKALIWGGSDDVLKGKLDQFKDNLEILKELYYQYHEKVFDIEKEPKCKPYKVNNEDEIYINESFVNKFKKYISDKILKDLTYHNLKDTKVKIPIVNVSANAILSEVAKWVKKYAKEL